MTRFHFQKLDAYVTAKQVAVLVHRLQIRDLELREQATRAAKSCFLNLAEGLPSKQSGIRRRHFASALGSIGELCAALDLAMAIGAVEESADLDAALSRLAPLVGGLLRAA